jgi:hypothetical protein
MSDSLDPVRALVAQRAIQWTMAAATSFHAARCCRLKPRSSLLRRRVACRWCFGSVVHRERSADARVLSTCLPQGRVRPQNRRVDFFAVYGDFTYNRVAPRGRAAQILAGRGAPQESAKAILRVE